MAYIRLQGKRLLRGAISLLVVFSIIVPSVYFSPQAQAAAVKTGPGMAAHALKAYQEGWIYQYAGYGQFVGNTRVTDCVGLIKSYLWWVDDNSNPKAGSFPTAGGSNAMYASATVKGTINYADPNSLPNIHGLGLYQTGHVGVYVGGNMGVDNRDVGINIKYEPVFGRARNKWEGWFKIPGVQYPDTGWVLINGKSFYYENGEYLANTSRELNGVSYSFGADGALVGTPPPQSDYLYTTYSNANTSVPPSGGTAQPAVPASLKEGSGGSSVVKLQKALKELGYFTEDLTGYYGEATKAAVAAFQKQAGLKETGVADQETQTRLYAKDAPKCPPPVYQEGSSGSAVQKLQQRLAALKYLEQEPANTYGPAVTEAVRAFQTVCGLPVTGKADATTCEKLYAEDAPVNPDAGVLRLGKSGEAVQNLQNRLRELRYLTVAVSGIFDETTEVAVKAYQAAAELEATGVLTPAQQEVLFGQDAVRSPDYQLLQIGYTGDDVKLLQQHLISLDYYEGEADGIFGEFTEAAVKAFQADCQLTQTGVAAPDLVQQMEEEITRRQQEADQRATASASKAMGSQIIIPRSAQRAAATAYALEQEAGEQQADSIGGTDVFWVLAVVFVTLSGTSLIFVVKRVPRFVLVYKRKRKIRRNLRAMEADRQ